MQFQECLEKFADALQTNSLVSARENFQAAEKLFAQIISQEDLPAKSSTLKLYFANLTSTFNALYDYSGILVSVESEKIHELLREYHEEARENISRIIKLLV